jgi:hypothetical protein
VARHQGLVVVLARARRADGDHLAQGRRGGAHGIDMAGEVGLRDHRHRAAGGAQVGDLAGREAEVGRHPDATDAEGGPAAFEQLAVVARVHQDGVALAQAQLLQGVGDGIDAAVDLGPGPLPVALDQARAVRMQARGLGQQLRQVAGMRAAGRRDRVRGGAGVRVRRPGRRRGRVGLRRRQHRAHAVASSTLR